MDTKIEIKEEDPLSDDVGSQNERVFFTKVVKMNTNSDAVLLDDDYDMAIKTKIKSETPFPDFCSQKVAEYFTRQPNRSEIVTLSNNCEIYTKTEIEEKTLNSDFVSQNVREFLEEHPVMKDKEYNSNNEMVCKIEIKEEPHWLETETSSVCDHIKAEIFAILAYAVHITKMLRERRVTICSDSQAAIKAPSAVRTTSKLVWECQRMLDKLGERGPVTLMWVPGHSGIRGNEVDKLARKGVAAFFVSPEPFCRIFIQSVKTDLAMWTSQHHSEHWMRTTTARQSYELIEGPVLKYKKIVITLSRDRIRVVDGDFSPVKSSRLCTDAVSSDSNAYLALPSAEVSGKDASFYNRKGHPDSQESSVTEIPTEENVHSEQSGKYSDEVNNSRTLYTKQDNLTEKYKCTICEKRFKYMSHLKCHVLIHIDERPHQCTVCGKNFIRLSDLKKHNLIHENKKPHQCKTCDKGFTQLSNLKKHNLIHQGEKPHQCKVCDKRFNDLSNLKKHSLIHDGSKPHQCKTCYRSFTDLSDLKKHNFIHEGKKPHQCKVCDKSFTRFSALKRHNWIHEGKKPHPCKTCDKGFTTLSNLKRHNLIHQSLKVI